MARVNPHYISDEDYRQMYVTGAKDMREEILTYLEDKYLGPHHPLPPRGSPKAQAILDLAGELAEHMRGLLSGY